MHTIKFDTGNYSLTFVGVLIDNADIFLEQGMEDLPETLKKVNALVLDGLRYNIEREVATEVYKQVAGVKNDKGKLTLPKEFKRTDVKFDPTTAKVFKEVAEKAMKVYGAFEVEVVENVRDETSPMIRATNFVKALAATEGTKVQLVATFEMLGMKDADKASDDELIAFAHSKKLGMGK